MSGAYEQQRDPGGRRGWWLVGLLAVIGAAIGAFAGSRLDPDVSELVPSLAVAGFGLGGLIGLLLLAPIGAWRAWRRRARRREAEPVDPPDASHAADPEPQAAPPAVVAPVREDTEPEPSEVLEPTPEPVPDEPPPPEGEEPGWYVDPRDGVRRYWDGQAWTGHVWRGRERARKQRSRP